MLTSFIYRDVSHTLNEKRRQRMRDGNAHQLRNVFPALLMHVIQITISNTKICTGV